MNRISLILVLLGALASLAAGASAPTFCKCTCFSNSTIIPLGPQHEPPTTPPSKGPPSDTGPPNSEQSSISGRFYRAVAGVVPAGVIAEDNNKYFPRSLRRGGDSSSVERRAASSSCAQCNRAFCLKYNLPICRDAVLADVATMCFQRDSRKDQIIVWGFILGTAGLLGWAAVRRVLEMREVKGFASLTGLGGRTAVPGGAAGAARSPGLQRWGPESSGGGRDEVARGIYSPLGNLDGGGDAGIETHGPG